MLTKQKMKQHKIKTKMRNLKVRNSAINSTIFFNQVCSGNGSCGILCNRSDGNYGDGLEPFGWTGSSSILEQFMKNNGDPVKYGQCWVAAGLATTSKLFKNTAEAAL
jgi:hypothetical protein